MGKVEWPRPVKNFRCGYTSDFFFLRRVHRREADEPAFRSHWVASAFENRCSGTRLSLEREGMNTPVFPISAPDILLEILALDPSLSAEWQIGPIQAYIVHIVHSGMFMEISLVIFT